MNLIEATIKTWDDNDDGCEWISDSNIDKLQAILAKFDDRKLVVSRGACMSVYNYGGFRVLYVVDGNIGNVSESISKMLVSLFAEYELEATVKISGGTTHDDVNARNDSVKEADDIYS